MMYAPAGGGRLNTRTPSLSGSLAVQSPIRRTICTSGAQPAWSRVAEPLHQASSASSISGSKALADAFAAPDATSAAADDDGAETGRCGWAGPEEAASASTSSVDTGPGSNSHADEYSAGGAGDLIIMG